MLISVIIPVYNVEKYLNQCIDSVLCQTYSDFEIILVDDGSTDGSPAICDRYAQQDKRVKVIHKKNGGLSDARNTGTDVASGDYIVYMDSDDFWASDDSLFKLVAEAKQTPECDFIGFNCSYYHEAGNKIIPWVEYGPKIQGVCHPRQCIAALVESGIFPMSACLKLIKRETIQGKITFIKGIYSEDIPWFIELLMKSRNCRFVNHYVYMYRKGVATSISSSFSHKKYNDIFHILKDGVENNNRVSDREVQNALFSFWAYELCILRAMTGFMDKEQRVAELKKLYEYDWLFKYTLNPKVRKVALVQKLFGKKTTNFVLYRYLRTRLV
ncbi:MAG: glycosyltransferase [Alistipes sp.]|nr:glycosyltransferase [Alistipes sp.]